MTDTQGRAAKGLGFLGRVVSLLALMTLLSRILGIVRQRAIVQVYAGTPDLDAFFFSFGQVELLRTILFSGALSSVFIPVFISIKEKQGHTEGIRTASNAISALAVVAVALSIVGWLSAPWIVRLLEVITPDQFPAGSFALTVSLMREMFFLITFIGLSGVFVGVLNALDHFTMPAIAPLLFNITIITLVLVFGDRNNIHVVSLAFLAGAGAQMLFQVPVIIKHGIIPPLKINFFDPALKEIMKLAPAAMMGFVAMAANKMVGNSIALKLQEGSLTALEIGFRVMQFPFAIFAVSVAQALFPTISRAVSEHDHDRLVSHVNRGVRLCLLLVLPSILGLAVVADKVIAGIFLGGEYTAAEALDATRAFSAYTWGVLPAGLVLLISRVFFAHKDTMRPFLAGLATVVANYFLALYLSSPDRLGFVGIAVTYSAVFWLNFIILYVLLKKHIAGYDYRSQARYWLGALVSAVVQILCGQWLVARFAAGPAEGIIANLTLAAVWGGLSILIYLAVFSLFRVPEISLGIDRLKGAFCRK